MTLEEAIKHYEKLAEAGERDAQRWVTDGWQSSFKSLTPEREAQYLSERKRLYNQCLKCAKEHRQLAEWLKELKAYRDTYKNYSKVEKMLICEVEKAKENPSVKKPIAYGLYQTWKFWDKNEVAREVNADEDSD